MLCSSCSCLPAEGWHLSPTVPTGPNPGGPLPPFAGEGSAGHCKASSELSLISTSRSQPSNSCGCRWALGCSLCFSRALLADGQTRRAGAWAGEECSKLSWCLARHQAAKKPSSVVFLNDTDAFMFSLSSCGCCAVTAALRHYCLAAGVYCGQMLINHILPGPLYYLEMPVKF